MVLKEELLFEQEVDWLLEVMQLRLNLFFNNETKVKNIGEIPQPKLPDSPKTPYFNLVLAQEFSFEERLLLIAAVVPHIRPEAYDLFLIKNEQTNRVFTEFGGLSNTVHCGFVPTVQTLAFILFGTNILERFTVREYLATTAKLMRLDTIELIYEQKTETFYDGKVVITPIFLATYVYGEEYVPAFNAKFPAQRLLSKLEWDDFVASPSVFRELGYIDTWLQWQQRIGMDQVLQKKINTGYKALFYGNPGTGKSLTASLLGKKHGRPVYRVDLSQVVSKYIGETEKNLANIFNQAEHKNWILFFDEADSLFAKRTAISDSKDRYANQESSYLLQRIENYDGLIILATNLKPNIDTAFLRRFQSVISFISPDAKERLVLWEKALKAIANLSQIEMEQLAKSYEITGGAINNVVQFAWLHTRRNENVTIGYDDLVRGIKREYAKEGKFSL